MVTQLTAAHSKALNKLKRVESNIVKLNGEKELLVQKNASSNASMQQVTKKYQQLTNKMTALESKSNNEKTIAFEKCHQTITKNKQIQWCAVCEEPGKSNRWCCSQKCEMEYW